MKIAGADPPCSLYRPGRLNRVAADNGGMADGVEAVFARLQFRSAFWRRPGMRADNYFGFEGGRNGR